jgi:lysosomal acid lipase/cholesteryl ester hydrolase
MGKYDIPAMIDEILTTTGQDKIFYIGHSMGTTGFMVMANEKPEYQDHVAMATFLSPVAYMDHMKSPIHYIAGFAGSLEVSHSVHI